MENIKWIELQLVRLQFKIAKILVNIANKLTGNNPNYPTFQRIDNHIRDLLDVNIPEQWDAKWDEAEELQKKHGGFLVIYDDHIELVNDPQGTCPRCGEYRVSPLHNCT